MTHLASLIAQQVNVSVIATLSHTTEKIAEQMAQEILNDPAFRTRMRALVTRALDRTFESLAADERSALIRRQSVWQVLCQCGCGAPIDPNSNGTKLYLNPRHKSKVQDQKRKAARAQKRAAMKRTPPRDPTP